MATELRVRKDVEKLSPEELDNLIFAFDHICNLRPTDPNSFFVIAGYHGEPFRGPGRTRGSGWWGGYCNHGNILFPTWHRAYLVRLEEALRTADGCEDLTMPYWNELKMGTGTGDTKAFAGVPPPIFLQKTYTYQTDLRGKKGESVQNPLFSYKFQQGLVDRTSDDTATSGNYTKPLGYETVRFPFSGLMGVVDEDHTREYNQTLVDLGQAVTDQALLNNVLTWLNVEHIDPTDGSKPVNAGIGQRFLNCLLAPNYTVFSNTTSADAWNQDHLDIRGFVKPIVPLEDPHNLIHLAVGGFNVPGPNGGDFNPKNPDHPSDPNQFEDANGDMGENNTASFDPIFFFHHCFIDLMFWRWQQKWGATQQLDIKYADDVPETDYPGTNSIDSQGPTPGVALGTRLTLDSPLEPFTKTVTVGDQQQQVTKTSRDVTDIVQQLGYKYDYKERDAKKGPLGDGKDEPSPILRVAGTANRNDIKGSFIVSTWREPSTEGGTPVLIDLKGFLSRWNVSGCANCQTHLDIGTHVALRGYTTTQAQDAAASGSFTSYLHTRKNPKGERFDFEPYVGTNAA
ncbi:putative tyrosinase [Apodospora peruviana]|uniref:tyrosinase n=1 Tax=Apodospora peruviana TaxID=516989 RepID=A0AAE0IQ80_9PEZI|nr:putative tyrosinase [Apodospora peruviana]